MVFDGEDAEMIWKNPIVDCEGETRQEIAADIFRNDPMPLGVLFYNADGRIDLIEKISAECGNSSFVKSSGFQ